MKTETGPRKWLWRVHVMMMSPSNHTTSGCRNPYFRGFFQVLALLSLIPGMFGCGGPGTSTDVSGKMGRIVSPDNRAVGGVRVLLLDTLLKGTNSFVDTIADTTDENGNFKLQVDAPGLYLLEAMDSVGRSFMDEVFIDDDDNLGTLKVDTMGSLDGFIFDNTNFKANVTVILYKRDMPFMYLWRRGAFTIDSLAPGDVRIQIGGWIDDYSRANKWIIFLDSTIQIIPGKETVIDTVFINEAALLKADGNAMGGCDGGPRFIMAAGHNQVFSIAWSVPPVLHCCPFLTLPFPADCGLIAGRHESIRFSKNGKSAGAAGFRFERNNG